MLGSAAAGAAGLDAQLEVLVLDLELGKVRLLHQIHDLFNLN
jgi:hypothetical protein